MPFKDMPARFTEAGRIRFGKKGNRGRPMALPRPRLTSPSYSLLTQIAEAYGGHVLPWKDAGHDEFQIEIERLPLRLVIPPIEGAIVQQWELWKGATTPAGRARGDGFMERVCEGLGHTCTLTSLENGPDGWHRITRDVDCLCTHEERLCTPRTRLWCHIRETGITNFWRVETGSWNAGAQMQTGLLPLIEAAQTMLDYLPVDLTMQQASRDGGRRRFYLPLFRVVQLPPRTEGLMIEERGLPALGMGSDRPQLTDDGGDVQQADLLD